MLKVYYVNAAPLEDPLIRDQWMQAIHSARREKLLHFRSQEEICRGLAASLLLRIALEAEHISYDESVIVAGEHGKPQILNQNIHFNISHAGEYAVCVICDQEVGADIEAIARFRDRPEQARHIAGRILCEKERKAWDECGASPEELAKIWTRKESFAKMTGIGLSIGLENIDTINDAFFQSMQPDGEYYLSVCTKEKCGPMQVFEMKLESLKIR